MGRGGLCLALGAALLVGSLPAVPLLAHPGGLAGDGCHNDRKNGGRHCHRGGSAPQRASSRGGSGPFANCSEAHAAGRYNIRRGDPAYRPKLERDNDGIACES